MPSQDLKRKRGAPPGNQNARKHGFYTNVLDAAQKHNLKQAALVSGIDEEIALLRVKLKSVVEHDPENIHLISQAAVSLGRLLRTRHQLNKGSGKGFYHAAENVMRDIGVPLGLNISKLVEFNRKHPEL